MNVSLSINEHIIIISNVIDGRWFAIKNDIGMQHCRGILINENSLREYLGKNLSETISPFFELLCKVERQQTYDKLPFHHLIFNTTYKCNLSCKYCYFSANSKGKSINSELIEYSINKCLRHIGKDCKLTVLFQGGEALLEYDTIRQALENLGEQPRINYQMQTNGTLITNEIMDFFQKYHIHVSFSLDSHIAKHNAFRSEKPEIFTNKILDVCDMFRKRNMEYGVISVVSNDNIDDLYGLVDEFIERDIHTFAFNLLWPIGRANAQKMNSNVVEIKELTMKLFDIYKKIYKYNELSGYAPFERFRERNLYMLWNRLFYRKYTNYMCMNTPCGAGINTLTIDANGDVYPCALMLPPLGIGHDIGNIYTDTISELLSRDSIIKHRDLGELSKCKTCPFRSACSGGGCGMAFYHSEKNINAPSLYCDYYYNILTLMIKHAMEKNNISTLKNF